MIVLYGSSFLALKEASTTISSDYRMNEAGKLFHNDDPNEFHPLSNEADCPVWYASIADSEQAPRYLFRISERRMLNRTDGFRKLFASYGIQTPEMSHLLSTPAGRKWPAGTPWRHYMTVFIRLEDRFTLISKRAIVHPVSMRRTPLISSRGEMSIFEVKQYISML